MLWNETAPVGRSQATINRTDLHPLQDRRSTHQLSELDQGFFSGTYVCKNRDRAKEALSVTANCYLLLAVVVYPQLSVLPKPQERFFQQKYLSSSNRPPGTVDRANPQ